MFYENNFNTELISLDVSELHLNKEDFLNYFYSKKLKINVYEGFLKMDNKKRVHLVECKTNDISDYNIIQYNNMYIELVSSPKKYIELVDIWGNK